MPDWLLTVIVLAIFVAGMVSNPDFQKFHRELYRDLEQLRKNIRKGLYKNRRS